MGKEEPWEAAGMWRYVAVVSRSAGVTKSGGGNEAGRKPAWPGRYVRLSPQVSVTEPKPVVYPAVWRVGARYRSVKVDRRRAG